MTTRSAEPMPTPAARPVVEAAARPMRPVRLDGLLVEFGFSTAQALKKWLQRRGLPCWLDGRDLWTDRAVLDEYFAQMRSTASAPAAAAAPSPVSDDALVSMITKKNGRGR